MISKPFRKLSKTAFNNKQGVLKTKQSSFHKKRLFIKAMLVIFEKILLYSAYH